MSPDAMLAAIVLLAVLLAAASALAGAFWARSRSAPMREALRLARDLTERQLALERRLDRLDPAGTSLGAGIADVRPRRHPTGPVTTRRQAARFDPPQATVLCPTLIAVPDLADVPPAVSEDEPDGRREITERFAPVWAMADQGQSVETIARAIGQPPGQVELILALRRTLDRTRDGLS